MQTAGLRPSPSRFGDAAGADAAGANPHAGVGFAHNDAYFLKVRVPPPSRKIVGVTYAISVNRAFVADFAALCHEGDLLEKIDEKYSTHPLSEGLDVLE